MTSFVATRCQLGRLASRNDPLAHILRAHSHALPNEATIETTDLDMGAEKGVPVRERGPADKGVGVPLEDCGDLANEASGWTEPCDGPRGEYPHAREPLHHRGDGVGLRTRLSRKSRVWA